MKEKINTTITIPKKLAERGDLVVVPREEYEALLELKKFRAIKEFTPTPAQKRALARARKNLKKANALTLHEVQKKLGLIR